MNNTVRLLLLFLLLGGITYWYTTQTNPKTTIDSADRNFAVPNIDQVHKIFIADRNGTSATLVKRANDWQYNGKWTANPNAMQNLLQVIQKVQLKYIPPNAAIQNIVTDIATHNIKVEIYDKADNNLKTYYVGGVTNDELGTYMIMEDSDNPYVMHLPGFEGSLRIRYLLKELEWRDKTIFKEPMEQIQAVSIEYPKQKNQSFKLQREADSFEILPFYEGTPKNPNSIKKGQVEKFLRGFDSLIAEAFENKNTKRDSITQQLPFCILSLETTQGQTKELRLHPIMKYDEKGNPLLRKDGRLMIERYYANVNNADLMLIQDRVFGKVLWAYELFF